MCFLTHPHSLHLSPERIQQLKQDQTQRVYIHFMRVGVSRELQGQKGNHIISPDCRSRKPRTKCCCFFSLMNGASSPALGSCRVWCRPGPCGGWGVGQAWGRSVHLHLPPGPLPSPGRSLPLSLRRPWWRRCWRAAGAAVTGYITRTTQRMTTAEWFTKLYFTCCP